MCKAPPELTGKKDIQIANSLTSDYIIFITLNPSDGAPTP